MAPVLPSSRLTPPLHTHCHPVFMTGGWRCCSQLRVLPIGVVTPQRSASASLGVIPATSLSNTLAWIHYRSCPCQSKSPLRDPQILPLPIKIAVAGPKNGARTRSFNNRSSRMCGCLLMHAWYSLPAKGAPATDVLLQKNSLYIMKGAVR